MAILHESRGYWPRVYCAVCGHQVERTEVDRSFVDDVTMIHVRCHGDSRRLTIPASYIQEHPREYRAIMSGQVIGWAFTPENIVAPDYVWSLSGDDAQRVAAQLQGPVAEANESALLQLPPPR